MSDRRPRIQAFLGQAGWADAERRPLAGDASNRRYDRLHRPDGATAVLMDAPPERGEDVRPFVRIAVYLSGLGLSAPRILHADDGAGLLLLEDLGDALFARVLRDGSGAEVELYAAAVDVLAALHRAAPPPGLAAYDVATMTRMAALAYDWYLRGATGGVDPVARDAFFAETETLLRAAAGGPSVVVLRDYHAENLIWLPDRAGVARVGLLDFQDAMLGHPAYDLVSLVTDARRDVPPAVAAATVERFLERTGAEREAFETAFAALAAQRNLRILGVFARLSLHFGKPHYVDLIPRVWGHLQTALRHPALAGLAARVSTDLPPPTPEILNTLQERCATVPTP